MTRDEEFKRQAVELVIHTSKRNLTLHIPCLICFGFGRDIASLTKGIPQAVATAHKAVGRFSSACHNPMLRAPMQPCCPCVVPEENNRS